MEDLLCTRKASTRLQLAFFHFSLLIHVHFFLNHFISYFRFHLEITDEKEHPISLFCIFRDLASHIQNYTYLLP